MPTARAPARECTQSESLGLHLSTLRNLTMPFPGELFPLCASAPYVELPLTSSPNNTSDPLFAFPFLPLAPLSFLSPLPTVRTIPSLSISGVTQTRVFASNNSYKRREEQGR